MDKVLVSRLFLCILISLQVEARIVSVQPEPGSTLDPSQYIQLEFSPPMTQEEFVELDALVEIRDEARGRLHWFPSGVGAPPYESVVLIPATDWSAASWIRLEAIVDSSLADSIALSPIHFRWPYLCDGCEWLGETMPWPIQLQGPASEALDILPLDFNRDNMIDLSFVRREQLLFFAVDTCAGNPLISGLGGLQLQDYSLDRELRATSLGTNTAGNQHPGEGLLVHSSGQEENVLLLARTGADNLPQFEPVLLEDGSYAGSPKIAIPIRLQPELLCQDLLVASRGGDLVHFLAAEDCSGLSDSTRVLWTGLGDPLDLELVQGITLPESGFQDYLFVLDVSPEPVQMLIWNGTDMVAGWTAEPDFTQNLTELEAWTDGDLDARPDVIAWNHEGDLLVVTNVDLQNDRADLFRWTYPEPLQDVESLPDGRLLLAGFNSIALMDDPRNGEWTVLVDEDELPDIPRRLRAFDIDSDGDTDMSLLFQDGRTLAWLDDPVGGSRLAALDTLTIADMAVGDTLDRRLVFRHQGTSGSMDLSFPDVPADEGFPFSWTNPGLVSMQPGDSLELDLRIHPQVEVDSCFSNGQFHVWWTFPDCIGQTGQHVVALCLKSGVPQPEFALDSLHVGESCGGIADCGDEGCANALITLHNTGSARLRLEELNLLPHPDEGASAPESFCITDPGNMELDSGDSLDLEIWFCPPMDEPWPWMQAALLEVRSNVNHADSLIVLPLSGLLTCPWPPVFTQDLPESVEDVSTWMDLEALVEDPDNSTDEIEMLFRGLTGHGEIPADSLIRISAQDGFRLQVEPGPHVNSQLYPELGLDLELHDPSGNVTRDTLLFRIQHVDDPLLLLTAPPDQLALREGRETELVFQWREVDADPLLKSFQLSIDEDFTDLLEDLQPQDASGNWTYSRELLAGDSVLYGGTLWWRLQLEDVAGSEGYSLEREGRLLLHALRDTLQMVEDSPILLDVGGWLLNPGEASSDWSADWLGLLGAGAENPDSLFMVEDLGGLLYQLSPGSDVNSVLYPGLGLLFELSRDNESRRDTLQLQLQAVEDAVKLLQAPWDATLPEEETNTLAWTLDEVDGDSFVGALQLSYQPEFTDLLDSFSFSATELEASWNHRPEVGDSLRHGGRVHWRVQALDDSPANGELLESGSVPILQSPQDLRLLLTSAPPETAHHGDSLRLDIRILSETGYVGGMQLRLEQDLQESARIEWPWSDLPSGAAIDTSLLMTMPLGGIESCWRLVLNAFNPAEDQLDNSLESCISLSQEPIGSEQNAFTPNNDGVNDELVFLFGRDPAQSGFRIEIYDLSGRQVLGRSLPNGQQQTSWRGEIEGSPLLPGVYVYVLLDGSRVLARGQVGLVR